MSEHTTLPEDQEPSKRSDTLKGQPLSENEELRALLSRLEEHHEGFREKVRERKRAGRLT